MHERKPLYMGKLQKGTEDLPIDGIDSLLRQSAERMGSYVMETQFATFFGTNHSWEYPAAFMGHPKQHDPTEGQPTLTSV